MSPRTGGQAGSTDNRIRQLWEAGHVARVQPPAVDGREKDTCPMPRTRTQAPFRVLAPSVVAMAVPRVTGDREYPLTVYPVADCQGSAEWVVAHLFRDVYGSHRWVLHTYTDAALTGIKDASNRVTYLLSPGLGASQAKQLSLDLLARLEGLAPAQQAPGVVIAHCDACWALHVWPANQNGDPEWRPLWCWHCHSTRPEFSLVK